DGKVTRTEFDDALQIMGETFGTTFTLSAQETSKGLFELLDTNRDGRLSVRELRNARQVLAAYDLNADGFLSEDEIPRQIALTIGTGREPGNVVQRTRFNTQPAPRPGSTAGPLWFRKMDRNGDGDVSRREFLGSPEDFKKLDLDGDGFISLEEAQKADAAL